MWQRRRRELADLFWEKVGKGQNGCWIWLAGVDGGGYGRLGPRKAHRVSWFLEHGEWPELDVLHKCDNPRCVRPDHLFLGDDKTNAEDRKAKGRNGDHKGTTNGRAILTDDDVRSIRRRYAAREAAPTALSREYGVSLPTVWYALKRGWKHL